MSFSRSGGSVSDHIHGRESNRFRSDLNFAHLRLPNRKPVAPDGTQERVADWLG